MNPVGTHMAKQDLWKQTMSYIVGRKKAEEFLGFLVETGAILNSQTSFYQTVPLVGKMTVPFLCDWFSVDLLFNSGKVRTITENHMDGIDVQQRNTLRSAFRPYFQYNSKGEPRAVITQKPKIYQWDNDQQDCDTPESILSKLNVQSALIIPLTVNKSCIGSIQILSFKNRDRRVLGPADMAMAEELGRRISLTVERSLFYHAREVQPHTSTSSRSNLSINQSKNFNHQYKI